MFRPSPTSRTITAAVKGGRATAASPRATGATIGLGMLRRRPRWAILAALGALSVPAPAAEWSVARSAHFEVYAEAGPEAARGALGWFEQLREFFLRQTGLAGRRRLPVRVIGFRSAKEYLAYRLRPVSDAYFVGTETRDYIVMPSLDTRDFRMAAHEYAHLVMHAAGARFPAWLNEGLAEFYSTVQFSERGSTLGGELAHHAQLLRRRPWMPMEQLLALPAEAPARLTREQASLVYAQSWALAHLFAISPDYRPRFAGLVAALAKGAAGREAIPAVYGRPLEDVARDARNWIQRKPLATMPLPPMTLGGPDVAVEAVPALYAELLLADLLLAAGDLERARARYLELSREAPEAAAIPAALGSIALRRGEPDTARRYWKQAMERGIGDAGLCYHYAILAEAAGLPAAEIRPALERALVLNPSFDDARYHLALLENNQGRPEAAAAHFQAMGTVPPTRAFSYWSGLADAFTQLGRRGEAQAAAAKAAQAATTPEERAHADQQSYLAQTELAVRFTRDAGGRPHLVTTRIPHRNTEWNPFVEPGDRIRRVEATLREIECGESRTVLVAESAGGRLRLLIADPTRVRIRDGPPEFVCGRQEPAPRVEIVYAESTDPASGVDGVVRGVDFR